MNPFDFVKSINSTKDYLITSEVEEREYKPFLVNNSLSLFQDTLFHANIMNLNSHLPNRMQYDYLYFSVRKKNRFSKWPKKVENTNVDCVMQYYKYNRVKAKQVLALLNEEQLNIIRTKIENSGA